MRTEQSQANTGKSGCFSRGQLGDSDHLWSLNLQMLFHYGNCSDFFLSSLNINVKYILTFSVKLRRIQRLEYNRGNKGKIDLSIHVAGGTSCSCSSNIPPCMQLSYYLFNDCKLPVLLFLIPCAIQILKAYHYPYSVIGSSTVLVEQDFLLPPAFSTFPLLLQPTASHAAFWALSNTQEQL